MFFFLECFLAVIVALYASCLVQYIKIRRVRGKQYAIILIRGVAVGGEHLFLNGDGDVNF